MARLATFSNFDPMRAWWLGVLVVLAVSSPAFAQEEGLYGRGRAALEAERGLEARRLFEEGLAREPEGEQRFRMLLGLALAHELLDAPDVSVWYYRAFTLAAEAHADGATPAWRARRERIEQERQKLEASLTSRTGALRVITAPAGARLVVDDVALPRELKAPQRLALLAGRHRLVATLDDRREEVTVTISGQGEQTLTLELPPPAPEPAPEPPPSAPVVPADREPPDPRPPPPPVTRLVIESSPAVTWAGVGIAGGGAVAMTTAAALFGLARADASALDDLQAEPPSPETQRRDIDLRTRIASRQAATIALTVTGGLMAIGGAVTIALNETAASSPELAVDVAPGGAWLRGRF